MISTGCSLYNVPLNVLSSEATVPQINFKHKMRSLPDNHPDKWIERLQSKMQQQKHYNVSRRPRYPNFTDWLEDMRKTEAENDTEIYMLIPAYAKAAIKKWLQMESCERLPNPENMKCYKCAERWADIFHSKIKECRNKSGGDKGGGKMVAWTKKSRDPYEVRSLWFQANILESCKNAYWKQTYVLYKESKVCKSCSKMISETSSDLNFECV